MSRVVIVARTRMHGDHVCIGAHDLDHEFRSMRLFDRHGNHWTTSSQFIVGDIWDIRYRTTYCRPPHVEDVKVIQQRLLGRMPVLKEMLLKHIRPWGGGPQALFDGTVQMTTSGTAYVPAGGRLPECSTGYWIPGDDLAQRTFETRVRFVWTGKNGSARFTWVGIAEQPERIARGSLVRVSLTRLFSPGTAPAGYYVQISGVI